MAIRSLGRPQNWWENDVKNDEYHEDMKLEGLHSGPT
jgi:hypothetical protein